MWGGISDAFVGQNFVILRRILLVKIFALLL